jgi:hypothetical protein
VRRAELEKMAAEMEAEIVYLPRGEKSGEAEGKDRPRGHGKRHHKK